MYYILVNPAAGGGRCESSLTRLKSYLAEHSIDYELGRSEYAGHAPQLIREAAEKGYTRILALGGDGTVYETVNGLAAAENAEKVVLGFLPGGTGNDFIRSLDLDGDTVNAFVQIHKGEEKTVDLWQVNGRFFANVVGLGLDTDLAEWAKKTKKIFSGMGAYIAALFLTLIRFQCKKLTLTVDGKRYEREVVVITISNGIYYGGGIKVAPGAQIDDGLLDIVLINKVNKLRIPFLLLKYIKGEHLSLDVCETFRGAEILVESDSALYESDGEIFPFEKLTIRPAGRMRVFAGSRKQ